MPPKHVLNVTFREIWTETSPAARAADLALTRTHIAANAEKPGAEALRLWAGYCVTAGILRAAMRRAGEDCGPLPRVPAGWAVVEA
jgi:hypothetical protein